MRNGWGVLAAPDTAQFITYDLEFIDDGKTIDLVSVGMVSGDGREMYAVSNNFNQEKLLRNKWMRENVWPHLPIDRSRLKESSDGYSFYPKDGNCRCARDEKNRYQCTHGCGKLDMDHPDVRSPGQIRRMVSDFILNSHPPRKDMDRDHVQLWAWYGAYDHVAMAQLFGPMIDLPNHIPMHTNDLKTEHMRLGGVEVPRQGRGAHNALDDARHNLTRARAIYATYLEGH